MRIRGYGIFHGCWLIVSWIYTKCFLPKMRLARIPLFYRKIGELEGGESLTLGYFNRIDIWHGGLLRVGKRCEINDFCHIACAADIKIGDDVLIASKVFITDHDHLIPKVGVAPRSTGIKTKAVSIGNRVWIGENVSILKGSIIEDDVVIGANSVVTGRVLRGTVAAGVPVKMLYVKETGD